MSRFRVSLMQLAPKGNYVSANMRKASEYCREAAERETDLILFPEMWSVGYDLRHIGLGSGAWKPFAQSADGEYVSHFRGLARELGTAIAITYLEDHGGAPRNSVSLIDAQGRLLHTYAKVHTCAFDIEKTLEPGDGFAVSVLETRRGDVKIGSMICFDREHPESARVLMLKGAEILIAPNACELERHRMAQLEARAFENMVGIAVANYPAPQCNGHSVAFSPIAFGKDKKFLDMKLLEAGEDEGIFTVEFDMEAIRVWRNREVWGKAYRRTGTYGALLE